LNGNLNLTDFVNLKKLDCSYNQLTGLNITGLTQLEEICCVDNYLNEFDYSSLRPDKLTYLDICDNNLSQQNLSVLSHLVNLRKLSIGSINRKRIRQNVYNRFSGSLESLKKLVLLSSLHISNTDINSGVEYLPDSLREIHCSAKDRSNSKVKEIV
jgi:Leucine-rich repeat (LRR) protein